MSASLLELESPAIGGAELELYTGDTDDSSEPEDDTPVNINDIPEPAARTLPWDGISTLDHSTFDERAHYTGEEVLRQAGLDWDVDIRPLWVRKGDGEFVQHKKAREVYRVDTEESLGTVKGRYQPFGNREAFAFGDALVKDGTGRWADAGQQLGGARVFMTMELGEGFQVLGEDAYSLYLLLRTSHDGGGSITADIVPFRMFCLNQGQLVASSHVTSWKVPHSTKVSERLEEAKHTLAVASAYEDSFKGLTEKLAGLQVSDKQVLKAISAAIPARRSRRDAMIQEIVDLYHASPTVAPFLGTGYGAWNAVTEYFDHAKPTRNGNARYESVTWGEGAKARNIVVQRLLALAA